MRKSFVHGALEYLELSSLASHASLNRAWSDLVYHDGPALVGSCRMPRESMTALTRVTRAIALRELNLQTVCKVACELKTLTTMPNLRTLALFPEEHTRHLRELVASSKTLDTVVLMPWFAGPEDQVFAALTSGVRRLQVVKDDTVMFVRFPWQMITRNDVTTEVYHEHAVIPSIQRDGERFMDYLISYLRTFMDGPPLAVLHPKNRLRLILFTIDLGPDAAAFRAQRQLWHKRTFGAFGDPRVMVRVSFDKSEFPDILKRYKC